MPTVLIDGREIEIPAGSRLNAIEAARRGGGGDSRTIAGIPG